jgi:hypothetical protein
VDDLRHISIAVRGDTKAARGVGRAAAALPDFPHPERVLMDGGVINPNWKDSHGRGPAYCHQLLEGQGVTFDGDRADKSRRVAWDELKRRDEAEPVEYLRPRTAVPPQCIGGGAAVVWRWSQLGLQHPGRVFFAAFPLPGLHDGDNRTSSYLLSLSADVATPQSVSAGRS